MTAYSGGSRDAEGADVTQDMDDSAASSAPMNAPPAPPAPPAPAPAPAPAPRDAAPRAAARAADQPRPASMLERVGWTVIALGVLVLAYFALTR